jgi:hypothetical protein
LSKAHRVAKLFVYLFAATLLAASAHAKVQIDFNPEPDFSQYKTFAYIGGVENLVMLRVNPDLINNRVHRAVTRELIGKGLREVTPDQNPDLVVRYWAKSSSQVNIAATGNWGPYGPYIGSYWGWIYSTITASSIREATLLLDLIDPHKKDLVWRLFLIRQLSNTDKDWKKANQDFDKGFASFPPSPKEIASKRKERQDHKPKPDQNANLTAPPQT